MFTIISRIFHFGFKNFSRNGWLSTATVAIMTLAAIGLLPPHPLRHVTHQGRAASIQGQDRYQRLFQDEYFGRSDFEHPAVARRACRKCKASHYISTRPGARDLSKQTHANDQNLTQAITELDSNPLEASLNIKAKDPSQYGRFQIISHSPNLTQYIDTSVMHENQDVIHRLAKIIRYVEGGWLATLLLALIAGLVVFNTIRLPSIRAAKKSASCASSALRTASCAARSSSKACSAVP